MKNGIGVNIGNRIRELRDARGFSQAILAEKCLKSVETISNFERGKTIPSVTTLEKLAKVLGVDIRSLFEFSSQSDKKSKAALNIEDRLQLLSSDDQETIAMIIDAMCKQRSKK